MKSFKNILMIAVVCAGLVMISGCAADTEALFTFDAKASILPKTRGFIGKEAKDVSNAGRGESLARKAMDNGIAKTPEDVKTIASTAF